MEIAVWRIMPAEERELAFKRLGLSLALIQRYTPVKFNALIKDINNILVAGDSTFLGCYVPRLSTVELYHDYVLDRRTTPEELASTLVHEA